MSAWVDCLTSIDEPTHRMTTVHAPSDGVFVLHLDHVDDFATRCPGLYASIIESTAFVNWRRTEIGQPPVLALAFYK